MKRLQKLLEELYNKTKRWSKGEDVEWTDIPIELQNEATLSKVERKELKEKILKQIK